MTDLTKKIRFLQEEAKKLQSDPKYREEKRALDLQKKRDYHKMTSEARTLYKKIVTANVLPQVLALIEGKTPKKVPAKK